MRYPYNVMNLIRDEEMSTCKLSSLLFSFACVLCCTPIPTFLHHFCICIHINIVMMHDVLLSAEMKLKLRRVLTLQLMCAAMCLSQAIMVRFDFPSLICFSGYVLGLPLALYALKYNSATCINLYGACCVFPSMYMLYMSLAVQQYRYMRIVLCVAVVVTNILGTYYAKQLVQAWMAIPASRSKKKS